MEAGFQYREGTHVEKTLEPKFDQVLEFQVPSLTALIESGDLNLKVYDKNTFRADVNLGEINLSMASLRQRRASPHKQTKPLADQAEDLEGEGGSLTFSIHFVEDSIEGSIDVKKAQQASAGSMESPPGSESSTTRSKKFGASKHGRIHSCIDHAWYCSFSCHVLSATTRYLP